MDADALVIGAGIAGLAAAGEVSRAGWRVVVLEARDRVGGRIETARSAEVAVPIELGAEFVHDLTPALRGLLERSGLELIRLEGDQWRVDRGRLSRDNRVFERITGIIERLGAAARPDRSVQDALASLSDVSESDRHSVLQYICGFHAADPARASAAAIAAAESGRSGAGGEQYRVRQGYSAVVDALASALPAEAIMRGARVARVAWRTGAVRVTAVTTDGASATHTAPCAIITAPFGVLTDAVPDIDFAPRPPLLTGMRSAIATGSALRVVLLFRERFWARLEGDDGTSVRNASFFHTTSERIPAWWTQHPRDVPLLVGWTGGPAAHELSALDDAALRDVALDVLALQFAQDRGKLADQVVGFWRSRWDTDPFARGAYSYVLTGGGDAARALPESVEDTLYFAGEACADGASRGTVHGALASGLATARQVLTRVAH